METKQKRSQNQCKLCNGEILLIQEEGTQAVARLCECSKTCPECNNTGLRYTTVNHTFSKKVGPKQYDVLVTCHCVPRKERAAIFNQIGIPAKLKRATFESYKPYTEGQEKALNVARSFAYDYKKGAQNKGFIVSGPVGAGKTHLLCAVLRYLCLEKGVKSRFIEIPLLYNYLRRAWRDGRRGGETIEPLAEVDLLAIDELGTGRGNDFEIETIDELIARRYNAGKTTIIATNASLDPDANTGGKIEEAARLSKNLTYTQTRDLFKESRREQTLRELTSNRIFSRICEICTFVPLPRDTPDYRRPHNETDHRFIPFPPPAASKPRNP